MNLRQKLLGNVSDEMVELNLGDLGIAYVKKPEFTFLTNFAIEMEKEDGLANNVVNFMIKSVYDKDDEGKFSKVFSAGDKEMLNKNTTPLHMEVLTYLTSEIAKMSKDKTGK